MPFEIVSLSRRAMLALAVLTVAALPAQAQSSRKVGVIGAGKIGGTIGARWVKAGYDVLFASRHPEKLKGMVEALGPTAHAGTPAEALSYGEAVLIAVPYKAYPSLAADLGEALKGKIVLDAGNAVKARDGDLRDEVDRDGIGVTSAKYLPGARLVRAFNAANVKVFAKNAGRDGGRMAIPIAGDDSGALETAKRLVTDAGFDPVVVGKLDDAKRFQMGSPGFGAELTAPELKETLGVSP